MGNRFEGDHICSSRLVIDSEEAKSALHHWVIDSEDASFQYSLFPLTTTAFHHRDDFVPGIRQKTVVVVWKTPFVLSVYSTRKTLTSFISHLLAGDSPPFPAENPITEPPPSFFLVGCLSPSSDSSLLKSLFSNLSQTPRLMSDSSFLLQPLPCSSPSILQWT